MKFYIAIPVYKAEAFLSECVSSVLSQTCQDFEIVLVDDGSPEGAAQNGLAEYHFGNPRDGEKQDAEMKRLYELHHGKI